MFATNSVPLGSRCSRLWNGLAVAGMVVALASAAWAREGDKPQQRGAEPVRSSNASSDNESAEGETSSEEPSRVAPELVERADAIILAMYRERERLVSGVYTYTGTKESRFFEDIPTPDGYYAGAVRGLCAFDHSRGLFRYDNAEPDYIRSFTADKYRAFIAGGEDRKAFPRKLVDLQLKHIRNREYVFAWDSRGQVWDNIELFPPDHHLRGNWTKLHHVHDVRAAGMLDFPEFSRPDGREPMPTVSDVCASLLTRRLVGFEDKDGIVLLTFRDKHPNYRVGRTTTIHIDTRRGYTATRLTSTIDDLTTTLGEGVSSTVVCTVQWEEVSGVRVPARFAIGVQEEIANADGTQQWQGSQEYSFVLRWESVNEPVDAAYFDYRRLTGIPDDTVFVYDRRGDKRELPGVWQADGSLRPFEEWLKVRAKRQP